MLHYNTQFIVGGSIILIIYIITLFVKERMWNFSLTGI